MPIPWERCCWEPAELAEVEADLAGRAMPDLWLRQWRSLLDRMAPGDALWRFWAATVHPAAPAPAAEPIPGFEQVRDAEALRRLGLAGPARGAVEFRDGYAVVRGGAVLDWIEDTS